MMYQSLEPEPEGAIFHKRSMPQDTHSSPHDTDTSIAYWLELNIQGHAQHCQPCASRVRRTCNARPVVGRWADGASKPKPLLDDEFELLDRVWARRLLHRAAVDASAPTVPRVGVVRGSNACHSPFDSCPTDLITRRRSNNWPCTSRAAAALRVSPEIMTYPGERLTCGENRLDSNRRSTALETRSSTS